MSKKQRESKQLYVIGFFNEDKKLCICNSFGDLHNKAKEDLANLRATSKLGFTMFKLISTNN